MENNSILPLSKSWAIRMIFLDMLYGEKTNYWVINYLKKQKDSTLADDIRSALACAVAYISGDDVFRVGNSGTVCRFLLYFLDGKKYKIIKGRQLAERKIEAPNNISKLSLAKLLKLGTSQFASVAILAGTRPVKNLPLRCQLSLVARKKYFKNNGKWTPKIDEVIMRQLDHFMRGGQFKAKIAEDYCYARAFNSITKAEGKRRWPELANHESDRLEVMEKVCKDFNRKINVPDDHQVVMAVALRQKSLGLPVRVSNKKCVSKSWPQFWQWLEKHS